MTACLTGNYILFYIYKIKNKKNPNKKHKLIDGLQDSRKQNPYIENINDMMSFLWLMDYGFPHGGIFFTYHLLKF